MQNPQNPDVNPPEVSPAETQTGYHPGDVLNKLSHALADAAKPAERSADDKRYHFGDWFLTPGLKAVAALAAPVAAAASEKVGSAYDQLADGAAQAGAGVVETVMKKRKAARQGDTSLVGTARAAAANIAANAAHETQEKLAAEAQPQQKHQFGDVAKGFVRGMYTALSAAATANVDAASNAVKGLGGSDADEANASDEDSSSAPSSPRR